MPNTNPRVSADEIRIKLDAAESQRENHEPPAAPIDQFEQKRPAPDPAPDPSAKPLWWDTPLDEVVFSLRLWDDLALPGGDVAMCVRIPEPLVQSLSAEAEHLHYTLGEMLRDLLQRASEYGWR